MGTVVLPVVVLKSPESTVIKHFHLDCLLLSDWDRDTRTSAVAYVVTCHFFCKKSLFLSSSSDQVLDWIENHGEAFLSKHTGVGKSLHRARALQKRHDDFEEVAQVRYCVWL